MASPLVVLTLPLALLQTPALEPERRAALERCLEDFRTSQGIPGLSAAVARDGQVVWSCGLGLADLENSVPARPETAYRSASIGKTLTAVGAMLLVEAGALDLDRPIQEHCPAFPEKPWPITPRQLLSHTAGIRHYGGPRDHEEQTSTEHYESVVRALDPFKDDPLRFEPGTEFGYSTYGFDVLGCVIEGAAGVPFLEWMHQAVFVPSGMVHTRDDDPFAIIPNRAAGYTRVDGLLTNAVRVDMSNRMPAGGYITTAPDLAAFAAAFMDDRLVSAETRRVMLTETRLRNGDTVNYGLGWAIGEDPGGRPDGTASHGGSSPGVSGMLRIVPARRMAVVVLTNLEDAPRRQETATELMRLLTSQD